MLRLAPRIVFFSGGVFGTCGLSRAVPLSFINLSVAGSTLRLEFNLSCPWTVPTFGRLPATFECLFNAPYLEQSEKAYFECSFCTPFPCFRKAFAIIRYYINIQNINLRNGTDEKNRCKWAVHRLTTSDIWRSAKLASRYSEIPSDDLIKIRILSQAVDYNDSEENATSVLFISDIFHEASHSEGRSKFDFCVEMIAHQ